MSTPSLELPTLAPPTASQQQGMLEPAERDQLIRRAKALSWLSLAYMTAEGAIGITAATLAGSVALLGFGLDSAIEALAINEGRQTWRGEGCCASASIPGEPGNACHEDCCT
ncbi:MAG: hypothetical protein ABSG43_28705 [Solirubrobacteraceae bacterium]